MSLLVRSAVSVLLAASLSSPATAAPEPVGDCSTLPRSTHTSVCKELCTYDRATHSFVCEFARASCDGTDITATSFPTDDDVTVYGTCGTDEFCCQHKGEPDLTFSGDLVGILGTNERDVISLDGLTNGPFGSRTVVARGFDGNDLIDGSTSSDPAYTEVLYGDDGCDLLRGHNGDDVLYTGDGEACIFPRDVAEGGAGADTLWGGSSTLFSSAPNILLDGGSGDDVLIAHATTRTEMFGGSEDDDLFGSSSSDLLNGDDGNDHIQGGGGVDTIDGGDDNDDILLDPSSSDCVVDGGPGDDRIVGSDGVDVLRGGDGFDQIHGGGGDDQIFGDAGTDWLAGGTGVDLLVGGTGNDTLCETQMTPGADLMVGDDIDEAALHIPDTTRHADRAFVEIGPFPTALYPGFGDVEVIYRDAANPWPYHLLLAPFASIWSGTPKGCVAAMALPDELLPLQP